MQNMLKQPIYKPDQLTKLSRTAIPTQLQTPPATSAQAQPHRMVLGCMRLGQTAQVSGRLCTHKDKVCPDIRKNWHGLTGITQCYG